MNSIEKDTTNNMPSVTGEAETENEKKWLFRNIKNRIVETIKNLSNKKKEG
jgi:hypothetical protein